MVQTYPKALEGKEKGRPCKYKKLEVSKSTKEGRGAYISSTAQTTSQFSGLGGGVDMIDSGQQQMLVHTAAKRWGQPPDWRHELAEQTPESGGREARSGNGDGCRGGGGALERQAGGQGRGQRLAEAGVRQQGRVRRRGLAPAGVGEARACAQESRGGAARARCLGPGGRSPGARRPREGAGWLGRPALPQAADAMLSAASRTARPPGM